jgi:exonuclease SbcD
MLVAHISDLHLGYSQFGLEEREEDVYATFNEAIDISIREGVKLVILGGDIFHTPRPNGKAIITLANALKKLKDKQIAVVYVLGEHDISRMRDVPLAHVFSNLGLAKRLRLDQPFVIEDCEVYGADKERRSNIDSLVERLQNHNSFGKTPEEEDRSSERSALSTEQKRQQQGEGGQRQQHGKPLPKSNATEKKTMRILVLHQGLTDMNKFAGEINSTDLPTGFDYYAMGHYHDHIEKRYPNLGGALLVYPGSIELTPSEGIKEVDKGFVIVDMSGQEPTTRWVTLTSRRPQFSVKIDYDRLTKGIEGIISKASSFAKKPVVKVLIDGKNIDPKVVAANLRRLNESCLHYVWQPADEQITSALALDERPADLDAELLRLARDALGSDDAANLAVRDILPPAAAGEPSAVLDIVWDVFKKKQDTNTGRASVSSSSSTTAPDATADENENSHFSDNRKDIERNDESTTTSTRNSKNATKVKNVRNDAQEV